jgi:hypothetical protein
MGMEGIRCKFYPAMCNKQKGHSGKFCGHDQKCVYQNKSDLKKKSNKESE